MENWLSKFVVLILIIFMSGCVTKKKCANRFPYEIKNEVKDSTHVSDTVIYYRTEIKIPPIGKVIKIDSIKCVENKPVLIKIKDSIVNPHLKIENEIKDNKLYTNCIQEDSLKATIDSLKQTITTISNFKYEKDTVIVEKEVPKKYIPKWVWYLIGLNVIQLVFRTRKIWIKLINPLS